MKFWSSVITHWRFYLPVALLVLQLVTACGWHRDHGLLVAERIAHQQDLNTFKKVQQDANNAAQAERVKLQKESKADADKADAQFSSTLAQYRASLLRYEATSSGRSSADHSQLSPTQGGNGSGSSSDVPTALNITESDAQICAVNTARLQAVHDWATNLPKDGTE